MKTTFASTSPSYGFKSPTCSNLPPPNSSNLNHHPNHIQYKPKHSTPHSISTTSFQLPHPKHLTPPQQPHLSTTLTVTEKLNILVSEFKSLPEPIERVKRLIHYASLLPELEQSCKVEPNRVTGCTAQVWLEVEVEVDGTMRFRVDSDSEITKGFCYCLVWLLDGAAAGDVIEVRVDDLSEMNVGVLPVRVSSRVVTWHNVLLTMQTRTRDLVMEGYTYGFSFKCSATHKKVAKHEKTCIENQYVFVSFAFDTFGALASAAVRFLKRVQQVVNSNTAHVKGQNFVFSRVGFAIEKGGAAQLVACLPAISL